MAHEIFGQNFFCVREPAWHKVGRVLPEAPTVADAIQFAGLDYEVEMVPLITEDRQEAVPRYATRRKDNGAILGTVGTSYHILQNNKAFDLFDPLVQSGDIVMESGGCLREGARVFLLASIPSINGDVGGDAIKTYFLFSNGHDGTMALRVGFTPVRVVCANTLAAATAKNDSKKIVRLRHTAGADRALDILRETINVQRQSFEMSVEQYQFLASRMFEMDKLDEFVIKVMGAKDDSKRVEKTIVSIRDFLTRPTNQTKASAGTWWGAYNAINEFLQYEYGRSDEGRLDSAWFGTNAERNENSLALAVGYAQNAPASGNRTTPATIIDIGKFRK